MSGDSGGVWGGGGGPGDGRGGARLLGRQVGRRPVDRPSRLLVLRRCPSSPRRARPTTSAAPPARHTQASGVVCDVV